MSTATEILGVIFGFIIVIVLINNLHELLMKKKGRRDEDEESGDDDDRQYRKERKRRGAAKSVDEMNREELLRGIDDLNTRIENMETIIRGRKKNGN
ncbi:MAG: hypothetical protein J5785_05920 [Spirochaetales bacterium]|nr:hypothetical protein [Spirochaetales bacterium]